jgi:hypothetical protein
MDHVTRGQLAGARDGRVPNLHWTMRVALALDRRSAAPTYRSRDTRTQNQVIVCGVDDRVDVLLDEVAADDHDAGRMDFSTSATR